MINKVNQVKLKNTKEEVLEAAKFLYTFSSDQEYVKNLQILVTYLEDITNSMLEYKQNAEQSSKMLNMFINKMDKALTGMPQDHKPKQRK